MEDSNNEIEDYNLTDNEIEELGDLYEMEEYFNGVGRL